eukprot:11162533-Lingulodinium_polyedra.AAC.1
MARRADPRGARKNRDGAGARQTARGNPDAGRAPGRGVAKRQRLGRLPGGLPLQRRRQTACRSRAGRIAPRRRQTAPAWPGAGRIAPCPCPGLKRSALSAPR